MRGREQLVDEYALVVVDDDEIKSRFREQVCELDGWSTDAPDAIGTTPNMRKRTRHIDAKLCELRRE